MKVVENMVVKGGRGDRKTTMDYEEMKKDERR